MCGLAGFLRAAAPGDGEAMGRTAAAMAATLAHRGPDDSGSLVDADGGIAMGFRRLAIQDLSPEGHQPMDSADGRYSVAFNGEIYNFQELRRDLDGAGGPDWRGHSDTEVLLAAVSAWGIERALTRFDGMFAIALWDRRERVLTLARDPMGEKPLYYGRVGRDVAFASELKALAAHPAWRPEVDREALAAYMRYSYVPAPHSIYRGIRKLPPGCLLTLGAGDLAGTADLPAPVAYWDAVRVAGSIEPFGGGPEEAVDELDRLLTRSVSRRMLSDVPLGAFLSGGIDSSAVAALMQRTASTPVRSFTIGFDDARFDEAGYARQVAAHLGTDHTEHYVDDAATLSLVERLAEVYDEPFADVSQLPTLLLAGLTRRDVTTVLTGDGGDELFCGYPRYTDTVARWREPSALARRMLDAAPFGALNALSAVAGKPGRFGDKLKRRLENRSAPDIERFYEGFVSRWRTVERPCGLPAIGYFADGAPRPDLDDPCARVMFADAVSYLPDDLLVKLDRAAMSVSLETRTPLLNREVVEFAWSLPSALKTREGKSKWPLRKLLYRHVPAELVDRPKMGFEPPLADWLRGPLRDWAASLLLSDRLGEDGLIDPRPVRAAWNEHMRGQRKWHFELWNVLMFESWRRRWLP